MDIEDLEPRNRAVKPKDLSTWNVEDLEAYVERLEAEATRARAEIAKKKAYRSGLDGLFKR